LGRRKKIVLLRIWKILGSTLDQEAWYIGLVNRVPSQPLQNNEVTVP